MLVGTARRLRSAIANSKDPVPARNDCRLTTFQLPVCPLTLELPTDPVIASDGKVYDLSAWQQYKKSMKARKKMLVSPVTKARIKGKVYPAVDVKAMIQDAVKNGHVADDLCSRWKDKIEREADFQKMIKDAQKNPMLWDVIGDCYNYGTDTPQCFAEAIKCYKKSLEHDKRHFESLRKLSILMCLRPETTRTDIINSWATICTLAQTWKDPHVHNMIALMLGKLPAKLRSKITTSFIHDIDEIDESVYSKNEKKQVDKWAKELALFLKDNSKSTRADESEEDDDDDDDDDEDSDRESQWEEYDPEAYE